MKRLDPFKGFRESREEFKKAVPSKVFYNHFSAIAMNITESKDKYDFKNINYYNTLKTKNPKFDIDQCRKLLWNAWSTEYALNISAGDGLDDYYRVAMHWHFPQAYYSVYLAMTAFHETQGTANDQHEKSIKIFSESVKHGHYPMAVSFYAEGGHEDFSYHNMSEYKGKNNDFQSLTKVKNLKDAHYQIVSFLKSTREKNVKDKRKRAETANSKNKFFQNGKGELLKNFKAKHWNKLYESIPQTSLLNIMYRLRIKANYHDIEAFLNAEIDFQSFHKCLCQIVGYINLVHEAYILKAIGKADYEKVLNGFNQNLCKDLSLKRYNSTLINL
ncbi:hypothetical protein [Belliella aquatica]|uniref:Sel1 repeat family protein n=1 Tax=Belliella aquatica TaxID=1323734 RepID=A0ABQ1N379_9BACT|nr:hypothetical protein [Belliella aquatica]MCH7407095.1 hypothetical protein [Belliella aquatica]GGC52214.1 hypothetical protein GCM10010993_33370 [Belliella aquatica]